MSANNKISNIIQTQLPFFVRNDHPQFVAFLQAWLEYNEQSASALSEGKVIERLKSMPDFWDIDKTHSELEERFFTWFLEAFPTDTIADKTLILKSVKDFLRARGTEKSVKFLLRAVYGLDADVYYPKLDILRVSDGNWYIQKVLRIGNLTVNGVANTELPAFELFVNRNVTGLSSNAAAIIDSFDRYFDSGVQVNELTLSSIKGSFDTSEQISANLVIEGTTTELLADVFGGQLSNPVINNGGTGYEINDPVVITDDVGTGGVARVSSVSSGNVATIQVTDGGAGFQVDDFALITGGGGSGANASVFTVDLTERYHPNSYNVYISSIAAESNTLLANTYASMNGASANTILANAFISFTYANTGPIQVMTVSEAGENYTSVPSITVQANTRIKSLGIIGRLTINDGGTGYANGDILEFENGFGGYGVGAYANVEVDGSGTIVAYNFLEAIGGIPPGGIGYTNANRPTINVSTSTGDGAANIAVDALLGGGEQLTSTTGSIGVITGINIINTGSGYGDPVANLQGSGDGTGNVSFTAIAGVFDYAGRYLDDDSHISGFSFLEDAAYYQNFSYVIRINESLHEYEHLINKILTPAGVIMFGEYMQEDNAAHLNVTTEGANVDSYITYYATYAANGQNVSFTTTNASNIANSDIITVEFLDGDTGNLTNGVFSVINVGSNTTFNVVHSNGTTETTGTAWVG